MKEKGEMKRAIGVKEQDGARGSQGTAVESQTQRNRGAGRGREGVIFRLECVTRSAACVALLIEE